jgi:hypothetical protein
MPDPKDPTEEIQKILDDLLKEPEATPATAPIKPTVPQAEGEAAWGMTEEEWQALIAANGEIIGRTPLDTTTTVAGVEFTNPNPKQYRVTFRNGTYIDIDISTPNRYNVIDPGTALAKLTGETAGLTPSEQLAREKWDVEKGRWDVEQEEQEKTRKEQTWVDSFNLYQQEIDKLQELQKNPRSWIEFSQRSSMLPTQQAWLHTSREAIPETAREAISPDLLRPEVQAALQREQKLVGQPEATTPDWLAKVYGTQTGAALPTNWKYPSASTWWSWTQPQKQMALGLAESQGTPAESIIEQMKKLYPMWSSPRARWQPAYQRA